MPKKFATNDPKIERKVLDTFTLDGLKERDSDTEDAELQLLEPPDSAKLMSLQLAARFHHTASDQTKFNAIAGVIDYLGACMRPDQYEMLYTFLTSPRSRGMDTAALMGLCVWVLETTSDFPTRRSTGSPGGQSSDGPKSTDGSPSEEQTQPT